MRHREVSGKHLTEERSVKCCEYSIRWAVKRHGTSKAIPATGIPHDVRAGFFFGMRRSIDKYAYDVGRGLLFNPSIRIIGQVAESRPPPLCVRALVPAPPGPTEQFRHSCLPADMCWRLCGW